MKKILSTLMLSSALFLIACGDSESKAGDTAEKPVYDLSTRASSVESFAKQGAKEGFNAEDSRTIYKLYVQYVGETYEAEFEENHKKGGSDMDVINKHVQGKTIAEMKKCVEKDFKEYQEMMKKYQEENADSRQ